MTVDTDRLWGMLRELEPKRQMQAVRGGFRRSATALRRAAVRNLRTSGLNATAEVQKGIRSVVFKKKPGFRVTVGTKRQRPMSYAGMSGGEANRVRAQRRLRIVPLWAEGGTQPRHTRGGFLRLGASRGSMPVYGFMDKTEREELGNITGTLHTDIEKNIEHIARKYGSEIT